MISEDSTQSTYGIFSGQTKESTPGNTTGEITEFTPVIITERLQIPHQELSNKQQNQQTRQKMYQPIRMMI
jgi:hypothetical protein